MYVVHIDFQNISPFRPHNYHVRTIIYPRKDVHSISGETLVQELFKTLVTLQPFLIWLVKDKLFVSEEKVETAKFVIQLLLPRILHLAVKVQKG